VSKTERGASKRVNSTRRGSSQPKTKTTTKRWSQAATAKSDALDLDRGVFALNSPAAIAASLKRSADRSRRRKSKPFQSAMSMLSFYINRAGRNLPERRLRILRQAKLDLRKLFGKKVEGE
jgi:hypothetical protein